MIFNDVKIDNSIFNFLNKEITVFMTNGNVNGKSKKLFYVSARWMGYLGKHGQSAQGD